MEPLAFLARNVLQAHDHLDAVHEHEPPSSEEEPYLPLDERAWLRWYEEESKPAYEAWRAAIDLLAAAMGPDFPGRHPFSFRPVCEELAGEAVSDRMVRREEAENESCQAFLSDRGEWGYHCFLCGRVKVGGMTLADAERGRDAHSCGVSDA